MYTCAVSCDRAGPWRRRPGRATAAWRAEVAPRGVVSACCGACASRRAWGVCMCMWLVCVRGCPTGCDKPRATRRPTSPPSSAGGPTQYGVGAAWRVAWGCDRFPITPGAVLRLRRPPRTARRAPQPPARVFACPPARGFARPPARPPAFALPCPLPLYVYIPFPVPGRRGADRWERIHFAKAGYMMVSDVGRTAIGCSSSDCRPAPARQPPPPARRG